MSNISSIDDLLMGVGNSQQPATPEHKESKEKLPDKAEPIDEIESDEPEYDNDDDGELEPSDDVDNDESDGNDAEEKSDEKSEPSSNEEGEDEYGNKKERMSQGMKDRLDRKEKQHQREIEQRDHELQVLRQQLSQQGASQEVQKAAKDFKYDPDDDGSWQQQLTDFVKQTVSSMNVEEQQKVRNQQEDKAQREFQKKFTQGIDRFDDFREVVGAQPIDDAMTLSLRAMKDPSAFIYAASKRHPQELERISKLPDPYARIAEMGRLEERMRRNKPPATTKTPRPLGRTREDATTKVTPKQKDTSGDDLLATADAKRLATVRTRQKSNR
jgi:hypothetical protein